MRHLPRNYITSKNSGKVFIEHIAKASGTILVSESDSSSSSVDEVTSSSPKFYPLLSSGSKPNAYSLVNLIRSTASTGPFSQGLKHHCQVLKCGFNFNVFVSTALINFYVKFERLFEAHLLFDEISEPSVVSWNTLISGFIHSGQFQKALNLFVQLERSNLRADSYSFTAALSASGQLSLVNVGRSLHSKIVKCGVDRSIFIANCLIDMYGKCGCAAEATRVFEHQLEKDDITWNSAISANARNTKLEEAFAIFQQMPYPDTISYNELIDGLARFGIIEEAISLLSNMSNSSSSSWNSIITGYVNRGRAQESLEFLCKMHSSGAHMDEYTFSIALSGIASLSAHIWGRLLHSCLLKHGLDRYLVVGTALIDMYFKCGLTKEAESLFRSMPRTNIVTWNTAISGYAHNGEYTKVIESFEELKSTEKITKPDEITFLNLFSACWHGKIPLKIAWSYFEMMVFDYSIDPTPEHCSFMLRLIGQQGDVSEATKMIRDMGFYSCAMVWKTLLGACAACGDVEVAKLAANKVIELGGDEQYVYVMMANIYARDGKWEEASRVRKLMREMNVIKEVGFSRIEVEHHIASLS